MRKSGWAAGTGLASLVLLLAACGGSSGSPTAAGSGSGSSAASGPASAPAPATTSATSATAAATATKSAGSGGGGTPSAKPHHSVGPLPSSGTVTFPPVGTTIMIVQRSAIGFVLAEANGQVVYTYGKDKKNGAPTCTGTCAQTWPPVTGTPKAGPADTFPGTFGVVKGAGGVEQITYNGYPLYLLKGAKPLTTKGNGMDGLWHVVPLSESDISGG